jgi:hypothetical protein
MSGFDQPLDEITLGQRVLRLEAEAILLRTAVAHLAAAATPAARLAIVQRLTGPAAGISPQLARTPAHDEVMTEMAREMLKMIADSASGR